MTTQTTPAAVRQSPRAAQPKPAPVAQRRSRAKRKTVAWKPEQKAAALAVLASAGGNTRAAVRQLAAAGQRVPEATLRAWKSQPLELPEEALVDEAKRSLDVILESVVGKIARGLDRSDAIARILSRPVQGATVLGILVDKLRILRGEATSITEQRTLSGFLATAKWLEPDAGSMPSPGSKPDLKADAEQMAETNARPN